MKQARPGAALLAVVLVMTMLFTACGGDPAVSDDSSIPGESTSTTTTGGGDAVTDPSDTSSVDPDASTGSQATDPTGSTTSPSGGGNSTATKKPTSSRTSSTQNRPTVKFEGSSTSGRVADLKGRVIRLQMSPSEDKTTTSYKKFQENIAAVEKKLNCKIEQVLMHGEAGDDNSITMSVLSGKPIVDIWANGTGFMANYKSGLVQNLTDLNVFDFEGNEWDPCMELMTFGGKAYGIRPANNGNTMWNAFVLLYNNRLLNEYVPQYADKLYEWQKNGEWTWDKFEEVCKAFNTAAGADPTLAAFYDRTGVAYSAMLATRGTGWIVADKNGKLSFNGSNKTAQEAMNQHKKWVSEGTMMFDSAENVNDGWVANVSGNPEGTAYGFLSGQCLFAFNIIGGYYWNVFQYAGTAQSVRDNVGAMLIPKMNASDDYINLIPVYIQGHVIPFGVQKPAEVATVMNLLMVEPLVKQSDDEVKKNWFATWLEPTYNNKTSKLTNETFEFAYDYANTATMDLGGYGIYGSSNIFGDKDSGWIGKYLYDISTGKIAQSAAIAAVKSKYNKILAEIV